MNVTRGKQIRTRHGAESIRITLGIEDLEVEEQDFRLQKFWPTLLGLKADMFIAITMYQDGLFHRKPDKNQELAGVEITRINKIRADIMAQVSK